MNISNKSINLDDFGVLYGFSLFETFLVNENGGVFLLDKHIHRLLDSMNFFEIHIDVHKDELELLIQNYIKDNSIQDKILRVTVTSGNKTEKISPSIMFSLRKNPYSRGSCEKGFKLALTDVRRNESSPIVRHKTANYMENLLTAKLAAKAGFDDALFLNTKSQISETTKSNIFFVSKGIIHTPEPDCGLLPGIIRDWVIDKSKELGIECKEGSYKLESLLDADEIFVTNSVMGIMPVKSIDNIAINCGLTGIMTKQLAKEYR